LAGSAWSPDRSPCGKSRCASTNARSQLDSMGNEGSEVPLDRGGDDLHACLLYQRALGLEFHL
jgi:hypothetical protein